jgi:hypothetical protein
MALPSVLKNAKARGIPKLPAGKVDLFAEGGADAFQIVFVVNGETDFAEVSDKSQNGFEVLAIGDEASFRVPAFDFGLPDMTIEMYIQRKADSKALMLSSEEMNDINEDDPFEGGAMSYFGMPCFDGAFHCLIMVHFQLKPAAGGAFTMLTGELEAELEFEKDCPLQSRKDLFGFLSSPTGAALFV